MERVTAYKSINGKLFLTKQECTAYENKLAQYPKKKVKEEKSKQTFCFGKWLDVDIVKYTESVWEKPSSQRKDNVYYTVGGKYKFTNSMDSIQNFNSQLMDGISLDARHPSKVDMYHLARYFAERVMFGDDFNDEYMRSVGNLINTLSDFHKYNIEIRVVEPNRKWVINNPSWHRGIVRPVAFEIEKL